MQSSSRGGRIRVAAMPFVASRHCNGHCGVIAISIARPLFQLLLLDPENNPYAASWVNQEATNVQFGAFD